MRKIRIKSTVVLLGAAGLSVLLVACGTSSSGNGSAGSKQSVHLGALMLMSGPDADYGRGLVTAIEYATQQPSNGADIKLDVQDIAPGPGAAVTGYQKLHSLSKVPLIFSSVTASSLQLLPLVARDHVVMMNAGLSSDFLKPNDWFTSTQFNIAPSTGVIANWVAKNKNVKRVVIINTNDDQGVSATKAMEAAAKAAGISIVARLDYTADTTDFAPIALQAIKAKPDAVYLSGFGGQMGSAAAALERAGYKGLYISNVTGGQTDVLKAAGSGVLDGRYFWPSQSLMSDPRKQKKFEEYFESKINRAPTSADVDYEVASEVITQIIEDLQKRDEDVTGDSIQKALLSGRSFDTSAGTIKFQSGESAHYAERPVTVFGAKGISFAPVAAVSADQATQWGRSGLQ